MTLLLAYAAEPVAFVAADSRLNLRDRAGGVGWHDEGELTISLNGEGIYTGSTHRKIQDLELGWIGGAGHHLFNRVALERLGGADARDLEGVRGTIRRTWTEWADRLRELLPNCPPEEGLFFLVREGERGFRLHQLGPNGDEANVGEAVDYLGSWPLDLPDPGRIRREFEFLFRPPTSVDDLCPALRSVAFAFDRVAELSVLVSPRMEVGLLLREPNGRVRQAHLAAPAKNVRQGSDDDVFELLSWEPPDGETRTR